VIISTFSKRRPGEIGSRNVLEGGRGAKEGQNPEERGEGLKEKDHLVKGLFEEITAD